MITYRFAGNLLAAATAITLLVSGSHRLSASVAEAERLDLREMIEEAIERNPEVLRAENEWESARSVPPQAGSLPDPTLMLGLRNVGFSELTLGDEMMSTATVSVGQTIPFPGKLGAKAEIARYEAESAGEKYNVTVLGIISKVKVAYFDYYYIEKSIDLVSKNRELLGEFAQTAQARYEVGEGIQQDVLKAQVEVSRLTERLKLMEQEREEIIARINRLLNRPVGTHLPPPAEFERSDFDYELEELYALALSQSPELMAEEKRVERDRTAFSLAKKEYYPDFSVSAGIASRGSLEDIWEIRLGIDVPIYFWKKQRNGVREAAFDLEASRDNHQAVQEEILYRIKSLYEVTETSKELVTLYEEGIIPQATLSLESAIAGYSVGKVDFLTLLDNLISLLEDDIKYNREVIRFEKNLSRLELAVGVQITGM